MIIIVVLKFKAQWIAAQARWDESTAFAANLINRLLIHLYLIIRRTVSKQGSFRWRAIHTKHFTFGQVFIEKK